MTVPCGGLALVIHPGALGDVLLAVPALRALRRRPGVHRVVLAGQPRIGALLAAVGVVDGWRDFEQLGLGPLFVEDAPLPAIDALAEAACAVCWFGARDPTFVRRLTTVAPGAIVASPSGEGSTPVWRHLLASVRASHGASCEPLVVPAALRAEGREALRTGGWGGDAPLLLVHAGAGGVGKRWPPAGFARVLNGLASQRRLTIAVHEGPADRGMGEALAAQLAAAPIVLREPSLPCLAGAMRVATAWLGNDSGVSHLAAAVGTPALVLFEASKLAWQPWSPTASVQIVRLAEMVEAEVAAVRAKLETLVR